MLLRTTPEFLRIFGVSSYEELETLPEIQALKAEEPKQAGEAAEGQASLNLAEAPARREEQPADRDAYGPEELEKQNPAGVDGQHFRPSETAELSDDQQAAASVLVYGAQDIAGDQDGEPM